MDMKNILGSEHKQKIKQAFAQLRKQGYFCRMNFWCCQSCAWSEVPEEKAKKVVFYHKQDAEAFGARSEMFLAWAGDAKEICRVLTANGLTVVTPQDNKTRIKVVA